MPYGTTSGRAFLLVNHLIASRETHTSQASSYIAVQSTEVSGSSAIGVAPTLIFVEAPRDKVLKLAKLADIQEKTEYAVASMATG